MSYPVVALQQDTLPKTTPERDFEERSRLGAGDGVQQRRDEAWLR
jgi:hypothetical protein